MDDITKAAIEIVKAQASTRPMTDDEITSMTVNVAAGIRLIDCGEAIAQDAAQVPTCDPKKAIKENSVVCLECGKVFKVLTRKHLALHNLTPEEYRAKWGYKKGASLASKSLVRERRKKMKDMRLWERRGVRGESAKAVQ